MEGAWRFFGYEAQGAPMSIREDGRAVSGVRTQLSATASPKARGESATAWRKRGKKAGMDEGPKEEGSRSGIETAAAMALGKGGFVFAAAGGGEAGGDGA